MIPSEATTYRKKELISLLEAFKELNSNIEIKEVFQNIILQMVQVVEAEAGTLWVVNHEQSVVEAVAVYGPTSSSILNIKLKMDEGIVGKVISTGEPYLIEDVSKEPSWSMRVDKKSGFNTNSMITVPLITKGEVIGALQLLNKKGKSFFTNEDEKIALALANQSALALQNSRMYDEISRMNISIIKTLAKVLDARDPYTSGHSERVAKYSNWIAIQMGMDSSTCDELYKAALLHDIGKIGVPDEILRKPTRLTNEEFDVIKRHPEIGADILSTMEPNRMMKDAIDTARSHHERFNGSGYPDKLAGEDIPLFARIVGVADAFDAMTTDRPYSKGLTFEEATEELIRCKHTLFEEKIVHAFILVLKEKNYIHDAHGEDVLDGGSNHEPI
jgi:HD-GYP domain-containing protein (c-di-GMP phosphodiesterase class II)